MAPKWGSAYALSRRGNHHRQVRIGLFTGSRRERLLAELCKRRKCRKPSSGKNIVRWQRAGHRQLHHLGKSVHSHGPRLLIEVDARPWIVRLPPEVHIAKVLGVPRASENCRADQRGMSGLPGIPEQQSHLSTNPLPRCHRLIQREVINDATVSLIGKIDNFKAWPNRARLKHLHAHENIRMPRLKSRNLVGALGNEHEVTHIVRTIPELLFADVIIRLRDRKGKAPARQALDGMSEWLQIAEQQKKKVRPIGVERPAKESKHIVQSPGPIPAALPKSPRYRGGDKGPAVRTT